MAGQTRVPILPISVALVRFFTIVVLAWIISYSAMSANPKWTVEVYVPWSFWLLHYLLMFGIVGGGWPLVAPFGTLGQPYWGGHGRVILGFLMVGLTIGAAAALSSFFVNVWWGYPLFPGGAWFGIGLFYITLWWVLDIQTTPNPIIPPHPFPPVNIITSSVICALLAVAVFQFVDYEGPFATDPSNPRGPVPATWWFACAVSIITYVHIFASILVFQSWPFSLLPNPMLQHGALLVVTVLLGWGTLAAVQAAGVDRGFFADAVGASQISWSLYHTVAFDFWPFHTMKQPQRGLYSLFLSQGVMPFFWIFLCRIMLQPIYDLMVEANPVYGALFTVHTMIPWFSLHVIAPLLIIHQAFFMRWPLPPGGPPLGPDDVGVEMTWDEDGVLVATMEEEIANLVTAETLPDEECQEGPVVQNDKDRK